MAFAFIKLGKRVGGGDDIIKKMPRQMAGT